MNAATVHTAYNVVSDVAVILALLAKATLPPDVVAQPLKVKPVRVKLFAVNAVAVLL